MALAAVTLVAVASPAFAAKPAKGGGGGSTTTLTTGIDVSYPQCGSSLPTNEAFGIVGLNGGLANDYNSCLGAQLAWAGALVPATKTQPVAQLYVNTADPGNTVSDWPWNSGGGVGAYPKSDGSTPYGTCASGNTETAPCAYIYGWDMVSGFHGTNVDIAGDVNDLKSTNGAGASAYRWWLDVETGNSWTNDQTMNIADLDGMNDALRAAGATFVGVYSTSSQWGQITGTPGSSVTSGTVTVNNTLYGTPDWIPGASTSSGATSNCHLTPFTGTSGGVVVTQWFGHPYDGDVSCTG